MTSFCIQRRSMRWFRCQKSGQQVRVNSWQTVLLLLDLLSIQKHWNWEYFQTEIGHLKQTAGLILQLKIIETIKRKAPISFFFMVNNNKSQHERKYLPEMEMRALDSLTADSLKWQLFLIVFTRSRWQSPRSWARLVTAGSCNMEGHEVEKWESESEHGS